jgi:predicted transcriptional regulator
MKLKYMILAIISSLVVVHAVDIGKRLPNITLDKENGGTSQAKAWHSSSLKVKVLI